MNTRTRRSALHWLGTFLIVAWTISAAPDIDSVSPRAIRPGVPSEIMLEGSGLSEAQHLWTSFPARIERISAGRFRITTDTAVGLGVLRAFGTNGVSNPGIVMVDDLPTSAGSTTNQSRTTAHPVALGSAVEGACPELNYHWFKLTLKKGQRVALEVAAARLGSKLDAVLRVMNAAGRELARNDDAPGFSGDSYLNLTAPESGDYYVELRDVNYGGGAAYFYRLRVGDFPLIASAFPPFAEQGTVASFQLADLGNKEHGVKASVPTNGAVRLAVKGRFGSGYARAFRSEMREFIEQEPNDGRANTVNGWAGLNGRFNKPGDRDVFQFTASKGERVEFRAATRSLGSACDAVLQLETLNGKRLAGSNPTTADEGTLAYSFPSNGTYRLVVEEASDAFGPQLVYHVSTQTPGFPLTLDTERVSAAPGKTFDLKVSTARSEFKGSIALAVEGPTGRLTVTNHMIDEGKTNMTMKVTVPESFVPGSLYQLTFHGTAKRDGKEISARASTAPAWRKLLPLVLHPSPEFDGVLMLGVTGTK